MCIFNKIYNLFELDRLKALIKYGNADYNQNPITADYYNGSNNDLENIFLELLKLSKTPVNVFNRIEYSDRIKFLAEEGLHILEVKDIDSGSFKVSKDQADAVILSLVKKTKKKITKNQVNKNIKTALDDYKKNVVSSVNLPKLKSKKKK